MEKIELKQALDACCIILEGITDLLKKDDNKRLKGIAFKMKEELDKNIRTLFIRNKGEIDTDDIEMVKIRTELLATFVNLYTNGTDSEIFDLGLILKNFLEGKKILIDNGPN